MYNLKTLACATLLIILAVTPAYAKRHGCDGPFEHDGKGPEHSERFKQALDLTAQQETDLKKIHVESKEETTSLREETKLNREALRAVFDAEVLDEPRLRELINTQAKLQADMMVAKHATRDKIDQILTSEQQKKHKEFRQQRMEQKGQRNCEKCGTGKALNM